MSYLHHIRPRYGEIDMQGIVPDQLDAGVSGTVAVEMLFEAVLTHVCGSRQPETRQRPAEETHRRAIRHARGASRPQM